MVVVPRPGRREDRARRVERLVAAEALGSVGVHGVESRRAAALVASVPSMADPVATMSAWFIVTRIWLLALVGQLAKKAGVLKKPTRGIDRTSSRAARKAGRS